MGYADRVRLRDNFADFMDTPHRRAFGGHSLTPATTLLWLALAGPPPDYYPIPSWPQSMEPIVNYYADVNLVPRWLAHRIVKRESRWNPAAQSREWREDKRGIWRPTDKIIAQGLCQITVNEAHRQELVEAAGLTLETFDWRNPGDSARVGMAFAGRLLVKFKGEFRPMLVGYNAGGYTASQWWAGKIALPIETQKYLKEILG